MTSPSAPMIIYFDTSIIIDYINISHLDWEHFQEKELHESNSDLLKNHLMNLIKNNKRMKKFIELRKMILNNNYNIKFVTSFLGIYEAQSWVSMERFKNDAHSSSYGRIGRDLSTKESRVILNNLRRDSKTNSFSDQLYRHYNDHFTPNEISGILVENVCLDLNSEQYFSNLRDYAYIQFGLADTLHLKAAQSLNCTHFATRDIDFTETKTEIKNDFNLVVLTIDDLIDLLKKTNGNNH